MSEVDGTVHEIKCWPGFFDALASGRKRFEVRYNDRDYQQGDTLHVREWDMIEYTGKDCWFWVEYVMPGGQMGVQPGYVVMSLRPALCFAKGQGTYGPTDVRTCTERRGHTRPHSDGYLTWVCDHDASYGNADGSRTCLLTGCGRTFSATTSDIQVGSELDPTQAGTSGVASGEAS